MSYDLNFWKYRRGVALDHNRVYRQLCDGDEVEGLERLPLDSIARRVNEHFADWQKLDEVTYDGGDRGGFQLYLTPQFFRVDSYEMNGDDMNKFIDIASEFGCPLFDPQAGKRFD